MMRMFVAVRPPAGALDDLDAFLEPRRAAGHGLRWTRPHQWHLTLAFLPRVDERRLDELRGRLADGAERAAPFEVRIGGAGAFPEASAARVLWLGVPAEAAERLTSLAVVSRNAASVSGIPVEGQRFHPHLTVARLGRRTEATRWLRVLDTYAGPAWTADELVVVESHPGAHGQTGARHEVRAAVTLDGAAP